MKSVKPRFCSVCGREPTEARGLCKSHYQKWRGGAPYEAPLMRTQKNLYTHCTVDGCPNTHYAKGLCIRHYQRRWAGIPPDGATILGEAHPNAKLTEEIVRHIRTQRRDGASYTELAAMFGVSYDTVRGVIIGRTWKHV